MYMQYNTILHDNCMKVFLCSTLPWLLLPMMLMNLWATNQYSMCQHFLPWVSIINMNNTTFTPWIIALISSSSSGSNRHRWVHSRVIPTIRRNWTLNKGTLPSTILGFFLAGGCERGCALVLFLSSGCSSASIIWMSSSQDSCYLLMLAVSTIASLAMPMHIIKHHYTYPSS